MIISHANRFIFLKTNKTAGTSIEIALSRFCAEMDVITPITPEDEATRQSLSARGAQNYRLPLRQYDRHDWVRLLFSGKRREFYNHISAKEVKEMVGEEIWNEYYTFCFERNPWDRIVSFYYWRTRNREPKPSISEFIRAGKAELLKQRGIELYTIDGEIAVDRVCLFENLEEELEAIRSRLGLPETLTLPRVKGAARKEKQHYRNLLSEEDREAIARLFEREITLFGYEY
jgi:hypothetical protein